MHRRVTAEHKILTKSELEALVAKLQSQLSTKEREIQKLVAGGAVVQYAPSASSQEVEELTNERDEEPEDESDD